jgi:hypothetical protein
MEIFLSSSGANMYLSSKMQQAGGMDLGGENHYNNSR